MLLEISFQCVSLVRRNPSPCIATVFLPLHRTP